MNFSDPKVAQVFAAYCEREEHDNALMKELGPEGFARRDEFLLPVGVEVGAFLHALVIGKKPKRIIEFGTSYGYSTLFLADAARSVGARVTTMEMADFKQGYAKEQLAKAGLDDVVNWRCGDAVELIAAEDGPFDFVLLDIWKELYVPCLEGVYPKLSEEAVIVSDNMIYPEMARPDIRQYRDAVRAKPDMHSTLLPIGQGIELSVKWSADNAKL